MRENPYMDEIYSRGFMTDLSKVRRNETSPLVYHKTFNYGDCVLEKRAAAAAGINEKIFINTKGQISEGTVCNVFFVRKNMIYTPQLSCGLLPGILREYIMERFQVTETIIYPDELMYYEECFVTNSLTVSYTHLSKQIVRTAKAVMTAVQGWEILSFWIRMMSVD